MGMLPDHVGQFRLAQRYWGVRQPGHHILLQRLSDGTPLALDIGDRPQAIAYLTRRYSEELVRRIVSRLPRGGLFFDVGAHVGLVSFQIAHRRPDVRVIAFEPNAEAAEAWRRNRRLNPSAQVELVHTALADRVGAVRMLARSTDLGATRVSSHGTGVEVPATTLDAYCTSSSINRIDAMKIDVEGFEPEVLEGASGLIRSGGVGSLLVEFNEGHFERRGGSRDQLVRWLEEHGMVPRGSLDAGDVMFAPAGSTPGD
jgi:FkbM family methyltransferase